ncbi:unnamed protein product [Symbiodinium natans]|uniref:Uncharacterized protein n=1 Tax=Symbiodinium natans TaxID=878477 RepID=A0A812QM71_9DINO|nr:unnamed protein product [Symbiodinium natans]
MRGTRNNPHKTRIGDGNVTSAETVILKDEEPETTGSEELARYFRLSKRFAALSKRTTLVALAPGTGKSTLTVLLNEALARKVDPMQFIELSIARLPKSLHYTAETLREVLGFGPPAFQYFADADAVFELPDPQWKPRVDKLRQIVDTVGQMPPGAYEEIVLDFWEQVQPAELPQILLMNDYGCEKAPWFTLRAKLPLKEMESRWRGRLAPDMSKDQAENAVRRWRRGWCNLFGKVLGFSEIVEALVSLLATTDCLKGPQTY